MAAEPDEPKPGEDERRAGRDRRRAPLTIDLTAESVAGKTPAVAATEPGSARAQAAQPPPARESDKSTAAKPAPRAESPSSANKPSPRPMASSPWAAVAGLFPPTSDREGWVGLG